MAATNTHPAAMTAALAKMAMLRQASDVTELTLELYVSELVKQDIAPQSVVAACAFFQGQERAEGETAFPEFGRLLRRCKIEAEREESRRTEAAYQAYIAHTNYRALPEPEPMTPEESRQHAKAVVADIKARVQAALAEKHGYTRPTAVNE